MHFRNLIIISAIFAISSAIFPTPHQFSGQFLTDNFLVQAATVPLSNIQLGDHVSLGGEQFIKVNNDGLLMMTSTYACPHGRKIAGAWVKCIVCDNDQHGYFDYVNDTCTCYSGYNYRSSDTKCIACPAQSEWDSETQVCKCTANYYMLGDNQSCQTCPNGSTARIGSVGLNSCQCQANYYMSGGSCLACPEGYVSTRGSTSIDDCFVLSPPLPVDADTTNCETPVAYMDNWAGCNQLNYFETVCLADPRDYRTYRVRKYTDGTCWMIDNMKFGGDYGEVDGCAANNGAGNLPANPYGYLNAQTAQETFSPGYYGHCKQDSNANGYLYNWPAVMQSTLAYPYSNNYNYSNQGLCADGWHVPSRYEFDYLDGIYPDPDNDYEYMETAYTDPDTYNFAEGVALSTTSDDYDGSYYVATVVAYDSYIMSGESGSYKGEGLPFRCKKN